MTQCPLKIFHDPRFAENSVCERAFEKVRFRDRRVASDISAAAVRALAGRELVGCTGGALPHVDAASIYIRARIRSTYTPTTHHAHLSIHIYINIPGSLKNSFAHTDIRLRLFFFLGSAESFVVKLKPLGFYRVYKSFIPQREESGTRSLRRPYFLGHVRRLVLFFFFFFFIFFALGHPLPFLFSFLFSSSLLLSAPFSFVRFLYSALSRAFLLSFSPSRVFSFSALLCLLFLLCFAAFVYPCFSVRLLLVCEF